LTDSKFKQRNFKWEYRAIILRLELGGKYSKDYCVNTVDKEDAVIMVQPL
jgi:hypothetical protein